MISFVYWKNSVSFMKTMEESRTFYSPVQTFVIKIPQKYRIFHHCSILSIQLSVLQTSLHNIDSRSEKFIQLCIHHGALWWPSMGPLPDLVDIRARLHPLLSSTCSYWSATNVPCHLHANWDLPLLHKHGKTYSLETKKHHQIAWNSSDHSDGNSGN